MIFLLIDILSITWSQLITVISYNGPYYHLYWPLLSAIVFLSWYLWQLLFTLCSVVQWCIDHILFSYEGLNVSHKRRFSVSVTNLFLFRWFFSTFFTALIVKKPSWLRLSTSFSDNYKNQRMHCHFRQKFKYTKQGCCFCWYKI